MRLRGSIKRGVLEALTFSGNNGATTIEISKRSNVERHTISKYLRHMEDEGIINCKSIGRAKVWCVNKKSVADLVNSENTSVVERTLIDILNKSPVGIIIIDKEFRIHFMNHIMKDRYGMLIGESFYTSILGLPNPLKVRGLIDIINRGDVDTCELKVTDKAGYSFIVKASRVVNDEAGLYIVIVAENLPEL